MRWDHVWVRSVCCLCESLFSFHPTCPPTLTFVRDSPSRNPSSMQGKGESSPASIHHHHQPQLSVSLTWIQCMAHEWVVEGGQIWEKGKAESQSVSVVVLTSQQQLVMLFLVSCCPTAPSALPTTIIVFYARKGRLFSNHQQVLSHATFRFSVWAKGDEICQQNVLRMHASVSRWVGIATYLLSSQDSNLVLDSTWLQVCIDPNFIDVICGEWYSIKSWSWSRGPVFPQITKIAEILATEKVLYACHNR